jgi:hypothetical protein
MTRELAGRLVITCDRCSARLDLGPVSPRLPHWHRTPSGWVSTGENSHACGLCAPGYTASFIRRFA